MSDILSEDELIELLQEAESSFKTFLSMLMTNESSLELRLCMYEKNKDPYCCVLMLVQRDNDAKVANLFPIAEIFSKEIIERFEEIYNDPAIYTEFHIISEEELTKCQETLEPSPNSFSISNSEKLH